MKKIIYAVLGLLVAIVAIILFNYVSLQKHMNQVLADDPRNKGVEVWVHYQYFINPTVIEYDLRKVDANNSPIDVNRVLLQYSHQVKDKKFDKVILAYKGTDKFYFKGDYFQQTGQEYGEQNPVYTLRTMPENVYKLNGEQQYATWEGGWLGVLGEQMKDLNKFAEDWYLNDMFANSK